MGYSEKDEMVRVDFFKESGKWYCTEAVEWIEYDGGSLIHDAFRESLRHHLKGRLVGMTAVCLEPHHIHSYPLMVKIENPEATNES